MYAKNTTSLLRFGASVNAQNLTMVRSSYFAHLNGILLIVMGISAHVGKNFYVTVGSKDWRIYAQIIQRWKTFKTLYKITIRNVRAYTQKASTSLLRIGVYAQKSNK